MMGTVLRVVMALFAVRVADALRGVEISIILPSKNNLPFVHWAMRNMLCELLVFDIEATKVSLKDCDSRRLPIKIRVRC
jgi:hypothetical protein